MQKANESQAAKSTHRRVKTSTTLNRKYVKRPAKSLDMTVPVKRSSKIQRFYSAPTAVKPKPQSKIVKETIKEPVKPHPIQQSAHAKMKSRYAAANPTPVKKMTAKELKDQAIKKALASAAATPKTSAAAPSTLTKEATKNTKKTGKIKIGAGRVVLALSCAAAVVFAIGYFINLNMPDISLKVAATQTGIDATYPSYIPNDYNLSGITSENEKITLDFYNAKDDKTFSLSEEKSAWDSNTLLNNYVKDAFGDNYSIIREQGITIYASKTEATWVNNRIVYKLSFEKGTLTDKQIRLIATSL